MNQHRKGMHMKKGALEVLTEGAKTEVGVQKSEVRREPVVFRIAGGMLNNLRNLRLSKMPQSGVP